MTSHLKRHSLANLADFRNRYPNHGRRSSIFSSFRGSLGAMGDLSANHGHLDRIQNGVIQLFQKKNLQENELYTLQEIISHLMKSEAGPLILDYYKEKILKKGMVILRENMKNDRGAVLLHKLSQQWDYFYTEILPILEALMYVVQSDEQTIRQVTLLDFRDTVLLKINFEETLDIRGIDITPAIKQMLLVLQGVRDLNHPTANFLILERLVARVIVPYLGLQGLYMGKADPVLVATVPVVNFADNDSDDADSLSHVNFLEEQLLHHGHAHKHHFLNPLKEKWKGRRHSIVQ